MNAYSQDLTENIVLAVFERGMGKSEAARALGVSLSSLKRYARAASVGKSLALKKKPGSYPSSMSEPGGFWRRTLSNVASSLYARGGIYLKGVVAGVSVSNSTVCGELGRMERTGKRTGKKGPEGSRAGGVLEGNPGSHGNRGKRCL